MNVNTTDRSSGNYINVTERYPNGTVTTTGYVNGNYFETTVITLLSDGYRLQEAVTGTIYANGTQANVQRRTVSESASYATPQHGYREYDNYDEYAPMPTNNRQSYAPYKASWEIN